MEGGWARGASKKIWDPLLISATVEASNFNLVHNLALGLIYQKNNYLDLDQNCWGSGPREHPNKIWDPLRISATVEANNFKCGTQIGFGTSLAKNSM